MPGMSAEFDKALRALLTDPATGDLYNECQVRMAGVYMALAVGGVIVLIALAMGLGEGR